MFHVRLTALILVTFILSSVAVFAQNDPLDLTETKAFTGFGFSIDYPAGWFADTQWTITAINELEEDHQRAFGDAFASDGISISLDHISTMILQSFGLPEEPTINDFYQLNADFFGLEELAPVEETELFGVNTLKAFVTDEVGNTALFYLGSMEDEFFLLSVKAPSEDELEAFLPTWEAMLVSIKPMIMIADFETSTFAGWTRRSNGSGDWYIYTDGGTPPNPYESDPNAPFEMPDPPEGEFAAVTDMFGPGTRIIYKDIVLDKPYTLHLTVFYVNYWESFLTPDTLSFDGEPNQQYRIDIIDPLASLETMADDEVLANVFRTVEGDPNSLEPTDITFDLSPWVGQTVRLRVVQVDNQFALRAGVDNIRLEPIE